MQLSAALNIWRNLLLLSTISALSLIAIPGDADAKTPGKTYCFRGYCHRVLTLAETEKLVGTETQLITSNYDDCKRDRFNPCGLTSSGAVFRADLADNAASPIYPDGTVILVRHPVTKKSAVLRVNSAGPYHGKRLLDVSRATAKALDFAKQGVATLEVKVLYAPTKTEAGYKKNRLYAAVPGYLGAFASLEQAANTYSLQARPTAVAALYPQTNDVSVRPTGSVMGNGIERTWLSKVATFGLTKQEVQISRIARAKATAQRTAKLERKVRKQS